MEANSSLEIRALRYLAQREYSRQELAHKLSHRSHAEIPEEVSQVLDKLEQQGFLSEERAAEHIARIRRTRFGSQRIIQELKSKGIDSHLIDEIVPALKETELETALHIWRKKFTQPPTTKEERAKQMRFMMNRGFSMQTIQQVFTQATEGNR